MCRKGGFFSESTCTEKKLHRLTLLDMGSSENEGPKKSIAYHFPHENCSVSCELTMTSPINKTMSFGKATARQKLDDSRLHQRSSHTLIKREVEPGGHWGAAPIVVLSLIVQRPTPLYTYFKIHKTSGVLPL